MEAAIMTGAALVVAGAVARRASRRRRRRHLTDPAFRARVLGDAIARGRIKQEALGVTHRT